MTGEERYDTVILGSGIAGLSAALAAQEMGLRPLVLEKGSRLGGVTTNSYGLIWIGDNHLARAAGVADSRDEIIAYMTYLGGGALVEDRMLTFVDRSPEALRFFESCGIGFKLVRGLTDHYFGKAPGGKDGGRSIEVELIAGAELGAWRDRILEPHEPCFVTAEEQVAWGGINRFSQWDQTIVAERKRLDMRGKGLGLICHFVKALAARGVEIRTDQEVANLRVEGGRVTGVEMASGAVIAADKGVVIATGGYYSNSEMAARLEGIPGLEQEPSSLAPPSMTGEGLVLAAEIGGIIHKVENSLRIQLAYTLPPKHPGELPVCVHAGIVELCSPHTLVVNRFGERFADESFFQGMVPHLRTFDAMRHEYVNIPAFLIFDAQYLRKFSFANQPVGSAVPESIPRADSIASLAGKLGIEADALVRTIERFNAFAASGVDQDFHRGEKKWRLASAEAKSGNPMLGTLAEPPFYGVKLHPTNPNSAGLLTDTLGRVLHQRRHPIPGLYASGVVAAHTESGVGYQAGLSLAAAMTFSYLALGHMAGRN